MGSMLDIGSNATSFEDDYERMHRLEKRLAAIDSKYEAFVTNKAFTDYFGYPHFYRLTDYIHPDEAEELKKFIDTFDGKSARRIFRFRLRNGSFRYNLLKLLSLKEDVSGKKTINIEMMDVENLASVNDHILEDVAKVRTLLGMTDEYAFSYNRLDNMFCLFKYEQYQRVNLYRMDIDEWKRGMLDHGHIAEEDTSMFNTMIGDMKSYSQSFSIKLNSNIRTQNSLMETLRFNGMLYKSGQDERIILGRIVPEANGNQQKTAQILDELHYDSLTNVYNKKSITEHAIKMLKEEKNNRVTIVILDVDHFKTVNDTYGHLYGDKVLARVGAKLKDIVGDDGVVGRIGGDEFMIILNGINDDQILRSVLRAMRTQIKWEFADDFDDFMITCSIGASIYPTNGTEFEDLFKKADYCLYIAKEKGRDRYVFFRDELHRQAYAESINKDSVTGQGNGRENRELQYFAGFMQQAIKTPELAIDDALQHMLNIYKLDSINVFQGEDLRRVRTYGKVLEYSEHAQYVRTEEFKKLMNGQNYVQIGFMGNIVNEAPFFCNTMRQRHVASTLQCIIGTPENIYGLVTLDKCKEGSQWADYEINCAVLFASFLSVLVSQKH
jgi:diguanylate cyclase (GGDEF)-like protein